MGTCRLPVENRLFLFVRRCAGLGCLCRFFASVRESYDFPVTEGNFPVGHVGKFIVMGDDDEGLA